MPAISRMRSTSRMGGCPNWRLYSRLKKEGVEILAEHEAPGFLEPQLLLELERAHGGDGFEMGVEPRYAHAELIPPQLSRRAATKVIEEHQSMYNAKAYSAASATSPLASTQIPRRDATEHDVQIEILFCGICHSDLHQVRNEWSGFMPTVYPCVPGHEIVGRVTKVGSGVSKFKLGDLAAVGVHGGLGRHLSQLQGGPRTVLPERHAYLQPPGQAPGAASPTAATRTASSWTSASC